MTKAGVDYWVGAEDLLGGQTVIDLTHRQWAGFSPAQEGFIWTTFHLSPSGDQLATVGCYWACPFVIKVYDFKSPYNCRCASVASWRCWMLRRCCWLGWTKSSW